MLEAMLKVDVIIDELDRSVIVRRLRGLKIIIDNDKEIQELLNNFKNAKGEYENNSFITEALKTSKRDLYNHPIIIEYRKLYSELNLSVNKFNRNILKLLDNSSNTCGKK